jgi:hypothetical protein
MATITGLTAARMQEIIDSTIVDADVIGDNLILTKDDGSTINAGSVRGPQGPPASNLGKGSAFPGSPTDGDLFVRTDQVGDPLYKFTDGAWAAAGGGLNKVTGFPASPQDGDVVVRTDLNGSPMFAYSTENGWEQTPRMGAVTIPSVRTRRTTTQSIPVTTPTAIGFDFEDFDTDAIHDNSTNNTRLTIKTPGVYRIEAVISLQGGSGGTNRQFFMTQTFAAGGNARIGQSTEAMQSVDTIRTVSAIAKFAAGDYVEILAYHDGTSPVTIMAAGSFPIFSATWLGGPGQTVDERGVPACRVTKSAIQTVPTGGTPLISFDQEDFDTDGIHDNVTNNTRMTCKTPGLYSIEGSINWASNTSTLARTVWICKNGTRVAEVAGGVAGQFETVQQIKATLLLAAGDYIELQVYQNSGSSIDIQATTNGAPHLSMTLVGSGKTVTPYARAYNSVTQAIPGGTNTAIGFNSERADNDTMHDPTTNNTRMVAKTAGVYAISGHIGLSSPLTTGRFAIWLRKTFASGGNTIMAIGNIPANAYEGSVATLDEMAVGDYYEVLVFSAGAVTVDNGQSYNAEFAMVKVGAPIAGQTGIDPVEATHVVGGAGEPAFTNGYVNNTSGIPELHFTKIEDVYI